MNCKRYLTKAVLLALAISADVVAVPLIAADTESQKDWSFDVAPYLWVANVDVETSLPDSGSTSTERFDTRIRAGAMLVAQAHFRSVGLFVDFAWLRLDTKALNPGPAFSAVDLRSDFIHSTAALTYRLPLEGKLHAEVLAGTRLWHVANDLQVAQGLLPGFESNPDKTWVDPMVGATLTYDLTKRWSVEVKGIVGGFGVSADIAGEVFAGVSYRFTDWCSATLGYRYLHEEYDRAFTFNLDAHGFLLGFGFHF